MRRLWSWWIFHFKRAYCLEYGWRGLFRPRPTYSFKDALLRGWSLLCFAGLIHLVLFLLVLFVILVAVILQ